MLDGPDFFDFVEDSLDFAGVKTFGWASGELPTTELLEAEDYSLDEMLRAMERLVAGELAGKVLVAPGR